MGLLSSAVPWALISWGELYISSGLAALLQATMPIFTVILASVLSAEEKLTRLNVLGVAMGFVGVGLLMLPDLQQGMRGSVLGQLAIIASSLSYGAGAVFARSRLRGQPAIVSTTGQFTTGLLFILPVALLVDRPYHLTPSLPAIGSWVMLAILGTVVAYIIYYYLIRRTTATLVSTVTYIIPVNALVLGALVLGESLSLSMAGGLALILMGVLLVRT
jgi:drug/metabolite transporter (DMT)-like permease